MHEDRDAKETLDNIQFGIGNQKLKDLKHCQEVAKIKLILDEKKKFQYSQTLYKVLNVEQRKGLRIVSTKTAKSLLKNQTIKEILAKSLKTLISSCKFLIYEDDNRDIILQLKYEEK